MPITEEWAKNPKAEVEIQCQSCRSRYSIKDGLKEEGIEVPNRSGITEMFWRCPACFYRKHACYMSPQLRVRQYDLKQTLAKYNESHASNDFTRYRNDLTAYQKVFDEEQEDIRESLEESGERSRA